MKQEFLITRKILKIGSQIVNVRLAHLQSFDLTSGQSETIQFFHRHPGFTASDLSKHLKISHQAARNIIVRLQAKQMLNVISSEVDARQREVYLTKEGGEVYLMLMRDGTGVGESMLAGFSEEEQSQFSSFLDRIIENLAN